MTNRILLIIVAAVAVLSWVAYEFVRNPDHLGIQRPVTQPSDAKILPPQAPGTATSVQQEQVADVQQLHAIGQLRVTAARQWKQPSVWSSIDQGTASTLESALEESISELGPSDPRVAQALGDAVRVCDRTEPDPYDSSNLLAPDPTRQWAVERILSLCEGFDRHQFKVNPQPFTDAGSVKLRDGKDAAILQAFRDIKTSHLLLPLVQAGTVLFETGEFPYAQVLPTAEQEYGLIDLNRAWILAVRLVLCTEQGPCGPNSLQVAEYCRESGCPQGADLITAYQRNLPGNLFSAVIAFANWMISQREPATR